MQTVESGLQAALAPIKAGANQGCPNRNYAQKRTDDSIPVENVTNFESALDSLGIPNEIYVYEGVGHAFANPSRDSYAPEQTADAWNKTLSFLKNSTQQEQ